MAQIPPAICISKANKIANGIFLGIVISNEWSSLGAGGVCSLGVVTFKILQAVQRWY